MSVAFLSNRLISPFVLHAQRTPAPTHAQNVAQPQMFTNGERPNRLMHARNDCNAVNEARLCVDLRAAMSSELPTTLPELQSLALLRRLYRHESRRRPMTTHPKLIVALFGLCSAVDRRAIDPRQISRSNMHLNQPLQRILEQKHNGSDVFHVIFAIALSVRIWLLHFRISRT